jgi:hypothetical protein
MSDSEATESLEGSSVFIALDNFVTGELASTSASRLNLPFLSR